jgi:uncharacterized lipoprotein YajG
MKKIFKIITMLFFVASFVFAAGCANKKTVTNNTTDTTNATTNLSTESGSNNPVTTEVPNGEVTTENMIKNNVTTNK